MINILEWKEKLPKSRKDKQNSKRIFGLDLLRAAAITLVLFAHSESFFDHIIFNSPLFHYAGFQGVELFFALSGFLIGSMLINRKISNAKELVRYYFRRWMRTLPAFFFALCILCYIYKPDIFTLLHIGTFTANILPDQTLNGLSFFSVSWSLAIEEWFYFFLGLFFFIFGYELKSIIVIWILLVLLRCTFLFNNNAMTYDVAHTLVWVRFDALIIGVIFASIKSLHKNTISKYKVFIRLTYAVGISIGLIMFLSHPWIQYRSPLFFTIFLPINSVLLAMLVMDFSDTPRWLDNNSTLPGNILRGLIIYISLISYSLYLYHLEVILMIKKFFQPTNILHLALVIPISIVIASLSYYLIEKPFLKVRDKYFSQ